MANSNIVGVKYIGGKPRKEDNVAGTGAVWVPSQTINFTMEVASKLIKFSDVWALDKANPNGETYFGAKKSPSLTIEPSPFINIHEMDAPSLVAYARVEFNKVLDAGTEIEALRKEIHGLMVNQTLDEIHEEKEKPVSYSISLKVTEAERDAFLAGDLILRLVPNLDEGNATPEVATTSSELVSDEVNTQNASPESNTEAVGGDNPNANEVEADGVSESQAAEEPLEVTLSKLDKKALREMCKELGIPVSNTMIEEVLRNKLLAKAGAK